VPLNIPDSLIEPKPAISHVAAKRIVVLSQHYYSSKRKANFHFLSEAFADLGYDVTFVTVQISPVSWLRKRDSRTCPQLWNEAGKLIQKRPNLKSFVWLTPFHIFSLRSKIADHLSTPLSYLYGHWPLGQMRKSILQADLFLFESTGGILLMDRFRKMNPDAAYVYRPSDNLRHLGAHQAIVTAEERLLSQFHFISSPSQEMCERAKKYSNVAFHPHGIDKIIFSQKFENPYPADSRTCAVSIGSAFFDYDFLRIAAQSLPDWAFHILGNVARTGTAPNIFYHGEIPFEQTIPYLHHAHVGLAAYRNQPEAKGLVDSSLKLTQYTWCRLPSVAPAYCMRADRPHIFGYDLSRPETIREALLAARNHNRHTIQRDEIDSWKGLATKILTHLPGKFATSD